MSDLYAFNPDAEGRIVHPGLIDELIADEVFVRVDGPAYRIMLFPNVAVDPLDTLVVKRLKATAEGLVVDSVGVLVEVGEDDHECGAWGGCWLPRGHNRGKADIPQNHSTVEVGEETE